MNTVKGLINGQPADLGKLDWANASEVGLRLKAETLPDDIRVLGTPLLAGTHNGLLMPNEGFFSYNGITCFPRLVLGVKQVSISSVAKIPKYTSVGGKQSVGWEGIFKTGGNNYPYSIRQWAALNMDNFGVQVSFTSPINLPAFAYELVFIPTKEIDSIKLLQANKTHPFNMSATTYPLAQKVQVDFPSNIRPNINFLCGSDQVANYIFNDLYERAQSAYWRIETDLSIVIGFRFAGLSAGQQFNNDGYFGATSGDGTVSDPANYLEGTRFQNTVGTGTLTEIGLNLSDTTPSGTIKMGVYSDNPSYPKTLLLYAGAMTAVNGWNSIASLSLAVVLNTYYHLTFGLSATNTVSTKSGTTAYWRDWTYANAWPSPFSYEDSETGYAMRAYVTLPAVFIPFKSYYPHILAH